MMFTTNALQAHIITQSEADILEDWIDENIQPNTVKCVPSEIVEIWDRVYLFNYTPSNVH